MGVRPSMGSVGDAYDNAMAESFFGTLECELLDRYSFRTPAEARRALFRYIEGWYNPRRRHSSLGYLSPARFEAKNWPENLVTLGPAELRAHPDGIVAGLGSTPLQSSGSF
jgi:transposase InsO family protein